MEPDAIQISLTPRAAAQHPYVVAALSSAGITVLRQSPAQVCAISETAPTARVAIGHGISTRIMRGSRIAVTIGHDDDDFGAALLAELLRDCPGFVVATAASRQLIGLASRVAARAATVLINGPTGSGKEVLARHIHQRSPRRSRPLVAVNCAALPEAMLEALLFGHERGAFTGATAAARGLIRAADGGTLFLDEIGELPLALQSKLLRTLQEHEVLPLGATAAQPVDVRVIAASNRDLGSEVAAGRFRADLYYRLAVFPLTIGALAARPGDLDALVAALLLRAQPDGPVLLPTVAARARLAAHGWPGNVRELDNVLQRALILCDGVGIDASDIVFDATAAPPLMLVPRALGGQIRLHEKAAIADALTACAGKRVATARRLGISERTLRYKLAAMRAPAAGMLQ